MQHVERKRIEVDSGQVFLALLRSFTHRKPGKRGYHSRQVKSTYLLLLFGMDQFGSDQLFERSRVRRHVYIYTGNGTSPSSIQGWHDTLRTTLHQPPDKIHETRSDTICRDVLAHSPYETTIIMPGGADLPYLESLKGEPVSLLREILINGGSYIGTCAGAYFASAACVFEAGDARLRVVGTRPLALLDYAAIGAVREGFAYGSEAGATVETLRCRWGNMQFDAKVYCNGGCGWAGVLDDEHTLVTARYSESVLRRHGVKEVRPAAVVARRFGQGSVVLSGVHPEISLDRGDEGRERLVQCMAEAAMM